MTEPTKPPPGRASLSTSAEPDPANLRLEVLTLAVSIAKSAPYCPPRTDAPRAEAIATEGDAVLKVAETFHAFLTAQETP